VAGSDPRFSGSTSTGRWSLPIPTRRKRSPADQHGDGLTPRLATLDASGEPLAIRRRPGNAGVGTAAESIQVLEMVLAQLPVDTTVQEVIVPTDSAG
jgi:hypothetical protein